MKAIDIIAFIIISSPFIKMVVFDQETLDEKRSLITYFIIGILSWIIGATYFYFSSTDEKWVVYFGSQMTFFFVIQYTFIAYLYRKIFNRNPEFSEVPNKNIDIIPTFIITMGTILIPLLLDSNFVHFVIK